jgi:ribosomal protein S18 acetylase RimI-like enzyme
MKELRPPQQINFGYLVCTRLSLRQKLMLYTHYGGAVKDLLIRRYHPADLPTIWSLSQIPHLGETADPTAPLALPPRTDPGPFDDLRNIEAAFVACGGDFLVAEFAGHVVAMGGIVPRGNGQAEVLRVRVHPALRRRGVGRAIMTALEQRAAELGLCELHLDTTVGQPEALAFYSALGYQEVGRQRFPHWELVFFAKRIVG